MAYPGVQGSGGEATQGQNEEQVLYNYFAQLCDPSNTMKVSDVQRFLNSVFKTNFSNEICALLLDLLDRDYSNSMGFNEFKELISCMKAMMSSFMQNDRDKTGYVDKNELSTVLRSVGYNLSPQMIDTILYRFDPETRQRLSFGSYVAVWIILRSITSQFRARDTKRNGVAKFSYDDFMSIAVYTKP